MGGAEIDVHIDVGYPFVINDEQLTTMAKRKAAEFAGAGNVEENRNAYGC